MIARATAARRASQSEARPFARARASRNEFIAASARGLLDHGLQVVEQFAPVITLLVDLLDPVVRHDLHQRLPFLELGGCGCLDGVTLFLGVVAAVLIPVLPGLAEQCRAGFAARLQQCRLVFRCQIIEGLGVRDDDEGGRAEPARHLEMSLQQLIQPEARHRFPRKYRAVHRAALRCFVGFRRRQRHGVEAKGFRHRQAGTGGADLQRLELIERLDRFGGVDPVGPAHKGDEQLRVGEFLRGETVLLVPLPHRRAAHGGLRAEERQLGALKYVKTSHGIARDRPNQVAPAGADKVVLAFHRGERGLVDLDGQIAARRFLDRLDPGRQCLNHLVARATPISHAQDLFFRFGRRLPEDGRGGRQPQRDHDLPHRLLLPRFSSCCGNSPVDRGAASSPVWKPRDVEPKLARTEVCRGRVMAKLIEGRESGFKTNPDYKITFEPSPRRVRVQLNGEWIADSTKAHLLFETRHLPVYYFPRSDVRLDLLTPTEHHSFCPYKGTASYWTIRVGDRMSENAVWGYPESYDEVAAIQDFVALYWDRVDHWYEEDEEIFVHPRDPYKRVDAVASSRGVQVVLGGEIVADTRRAHFVFETRLPTRYYIPQEDVRMELLVPSEKTSACPYKGRARYWSAKLGGRDYPDIVWFYPEPIPECPKIRGLLSFFNEQVDAILIDGIEVPRPVTPWSKDWKEKAATVPDTRGPVTRP